MNKNKKNPRNRKPAGVKQSNSSADVELMNELMKALTLWAEVTYNNDPSAPCVLHTKAEFRDLPTISLPWQCKDAMDACKTGAELIAQVVSSARATEFNLTLLDDAIHVEIDDMIKVTLQLDKQ